MIERYEAPVLLVFGGVCLAYALNIARYKAMFW